MNDINRYIVWIRNRDIMQRMIMYMIKCDNMSRDMSIICPQFMSNDNMSIIDRIKIY